MRVLFLIILLFCFCLEPFAQNLTVKLFFEDNIGRKDSLELGLNDTSSVGIDTSLNEIDIYGTPFDSLDARVIQRDSMALYCSYPYLGSGIYFPQNRDSKTDYRPFLDHLQLDGFNSLNNNFQIFFNAVDYPVVISGEVNDQGSNHITAFSLIHVLDTNCVIQNDYGVSYLNVYDSLFTITNSSVNRLAISFQYHLSVDDYKNFKLQFQLFPNPSNGSVSLSFDKLFSGFVNVRNIAGSQVFSQQLHNNKRYNFDISEFPNGIYFVEIEDEQGKRNFKKLIVNN